METPATVLKILQSYTFYIELNANDFFGYACADSVKTDNVDLLIKTITNFGQGGLEAFMVHSRGGYPISPIVEKLKSSQYTEALAWLQKEYSSVYQTDLNVWPEKG